MLAPCRPDQSSAAILREHIGQFALDLLQLLASSARPRSAASRKRRLELAPCGVRSCAHARRSVRRTPSSPAGTVRSRGIDGRGKLCACACRYWRPRRLAVRASSASSRSNDPGIVGDQRLFAGNVGIKLGEALLEFAAAGGKARDFLVELVAGDGQALRARRRPWPRPRAVPAGCAAAIACSLAALICACAPFRQRQGGADKRALRLALPADLAAVQRRWNSSASVARISAESVLIAVGLPGLALQASRSGASSCADHVVEPLEVLLGGAQAQFGLVAARMQAGNAGGLFQQRAARLRLGLRSVRRCAPARPWTASARRWRRRRTAAARPWRGLRLPLMR